MILTVAKPDLQERHRINQDIRVPEVRVVSDSGEQLGVLKIIEAIAIAHNQKLDLVEIAPQAIPPVCKILNYNKFRYEEKKKARDVAKKNREARVELKELWLRPVTEKHDIDVKVRHAKEFLAHGDKVKFTVKFRGREITHVEQGRGLLESILTMLGDDIKIDLPIKQTGRQMILIVSAQVKK